MGQNIAKRKNVTYRISSQHVFTINKSLRGILNTKMCGRKVTVSLDAETLQPLQFI